jgi:crotonobetainyl-CoA:carnitine CoA-transferase CaiB-like acyl-CoA transferase
MPKDNVPTLFECGDGRWLHLMARPDAAPLMAAELAAMGEAGVAAANAAGPPSGLSPNFGANAAAFRRHDRARWLADLWASDVPADGVEPLGHLFTDEQALANGYVVEVDDPELGTTRQAGTPFSTTPPSRVRGPAPRLGQHTAEVFARDRQPPPGVRPADGVRSADGPAAVPPPLAGLRVLDLGNFLAGPMAGMMLADLGADVVKLESLTGDQMRRVSRVFVGCQRGKRGVAADLRRPEAREIVDALVGWADVVHHNLRMPAARRLGLEPERLLELNPRLVYCHVSSYGPRGPRANWPGFDQLFQASAGWELAGAGEGNPPMWHRFGMMDHQCAMASLVATLLALHHRERTGRGQLVTASILGASVLTTSETLLRADGTVAPVPTLDADQCGVGPGQRLYEMADGWIAVAARDPHALEALCRVAGLAPDAAATSIAAALGPRPAGEVLVELEKAGVPAEPVAVDQLTAFLDDPVGRAARLSVGYPHADYGWTEQVGALWDLGDTELSLGRAAPGIGEHTIEVLREVGFAAGRIVGLAEAGVVRGAGLPTGP